MSKQLHPSTIKVNNKQKAKAKLSRSHALQWLAQNFPHAFDDSMSIHPLKIGIMQDLLAHAERASEAGISKTKLREALIIFTRRIDYLTCLKAREMRIDLEGNPTAIVTEEEAALAAAKIKKHIEKSAKIARLNAAQETSSTKSGSQITYALTPDSIPYASDMRFDPRFAATAQPARTTPVIVKHKAAKSYDPEAVARLKEKLGLSRGRDLQS